MHLEDFMGSKLGDVDIIQKFQKAFFEIRAKELNISMGELMIEGDVQAKKEVFTESLIHLGLLDGSTKNLSLHIQEITKNWEDGVILYRGTRLPEDNGSFHIDGVHATPKIDIALAYANGGVNISTGIGQLLNERKIGFLHSYKVPLNTKVYENFQYEDFKGNKIVDTNNTLQDLKNCVESMKKYTQEEFDNNSDLIDNWRDILSNKSFYESIVPTNTESNSSFIVMNKEVYKINRDNPDINKILGRLQEIILKDFYEIKPLKDMKVDMEVRKKEEDFPYVYATINKELKERLEKSLISKNLSDVSLSNNNFIQNNSHVLNSKYIGSSMEQNDVVYPFEIKTLKHITRNVVLGDVSNIENDLRDFMAKKNVMNNIRKVTNQEKELKEDVLNKKSLII